MDICITCYIVVKENPLIVVISLEKKTAAEAVTTAQPVLEAVRDPGYICVCAHGNRAAAGIYTEPERQLAWEAPAAWAQARPRAPGSRLALCHCFSVNPRGPPNRQAGSSIAP